MRIFITLAAVVALVLMLAMGLTRDPRALPSVLLDQPAPEFQRPLLGDPSQQLSSTALRGHVWLLNVWASWCGPCREELPGLRQWAQLDGVTVYGLNYKDKPEAAQAMLTNIGNPYRASAVDADGRVGMDYGVQGVPETFVIDAQGRIRYRHQGPVTEAIWRERLMPVIRSLQ
ncbi:cytochrome c biogenesis protein CcmG, thiol:disulfide interchange protein DsbE [Roseateles sp. YR242]|uniref:DsbE family thiol:disulfide interchange protein n=1 Tax=Roseateles sp. YR242 TaxID=1855305 RepID=UPI0008C447E0|nr:DsbE family thiol:disulfide interchange protein [Roseateles sp. YR242]SEK97632.1 cytochrome c biogenesis protein CcmG, thiol:disulfide interchange protein DsbE [Roseateles sp. YR242]